MFFRQVENIIIESFCHLFPICVTVRLILLESVLTSSIVFCYSNYEQSKGSIMLKVMS